LRRERRARRGAGEKYKDYRDWCKVGDIMKIKNHLTKEGLDQVIKIKAGMNRGRYWLIS